MRYFRKIGSIGWFVWQTRHHLGHLMVGLIFAWILRELWGEFQPRYVFLALLGSELIDIDHILYAFVYGRHEWYAIEVRKFLRAGELRNLTMFLNKNHKYNTDLATHNIYFIGFFFLLSFVCFQFDSKSGFILFGATALHLLVDIFDDLWVLGHVNENWKRLRRKKAEIAKISS